MEIEIDNLEDMCSLMCSNTIPTKQTTCKRCGRKLRNKQAIELGMGATCFKKYQSENNHKKLWEEDKKENE